ncbi:MAG TPA: stalk domain-containing protein [Fimbriimonadales bacterium]|nr:stalk domain-containing protein [Fimbriimonadales bacterium]
MKAKTFLILSSLCFVSSLFSQTIRVEINGNQVHLDVAPKMVQSRVLVPLRGIFEHLGAAVEWQPSARMIYARKGARTIEMRIGSSTAKVNGSEIMLDVPARIYASTTFIPLRFVSEALGAEVRWDDYRRIVEITTAGPIEEDVSERIEGTGTIAYINHNASGVISAGNTITVTMEGTPGGRAYFRIPGVVNEVPMKEISPGKYEGTWTVSRDKEFAISGASVIGILRIGNREVLMQAEEKITLDTTAPKILAVTPVANSRVDARNLSITAVFDDATGSGIEPESVKVLFDGTDVTSKATISSNLVYFKPTAVAAGRHNVTITVRDRARNPLMHSWSFEVSDVAKAIKSFTHEAPEVPEPGDVIRTRLEAEANGSATFSIGNIRNIPMQEIATGVYVGEYTVRKGDNLQNAIITATFKSRNGEVYTVETGSKISVDGGVPDPPTIISPTEGQKVTGNVVVRGTTAPNGRVLVHIEYETTVLGAVTLTGTLYEKVLTANARGEFATEAIDVTPLVRGSDTRYTIRAYSLNATNERSGPTTIHFVR